MKMILLKVIESNSHEFIGDLVDRAGITSIATFFGIKIADEADLIELATSISEPWHTVDWIAVLASIGTVTFIIKNVMTARKIYLENKLLKIDIKNKEE